jgi:hypothetical protein
MRAHWAQISNYLWELKIIRKRTHARTHAHTPTLRSEHCSVGLTFLDITAHKQNNVPERIRSA